MKRQFKGILREEDAIEVVGQTLIFKCLKCPRKIKSKRSSLHTHSGMCNKCAQRKRPFESIYTSLTRSDNYTPKNSTLTYEEFLQFTKIQHCHYCTTEIKWTEFRGSTDLKRYYLDRKNSGLGYHMYNVVACCSSCNYLKSDKFTYEEFMLLGPALREVAIKRGLNVKS